MRRLKTLGLAIMVVFALAAIAAATASAAPLPTFLWSGKVPTPTEPVTLTGGSGRLVFQKSPNGSSVACQKRISKGEFTSASLGSYDNLFEGCEAFGFKCKGLEDATEGSILAKGTFHLVFDTLTSTLGVGGAFLPKPVHFECGGIVSVVVEGCLLGLIKPINKLLASKEKYELIITQKEGKNTEISYYNDAGALVGCLLLSKEGAGEFKQSGLEAKEAFVNEAKVGTKEVSTEIMG